MTTDASAPTRRRAPSGLALVATAAVLWATIGLFTPALLDRGLTAVEIGFWRALLAGVLFVVHGVLRGGLRVRDRRDAGRLVVFGAVAVGLFYVALAAAIEHGGVSLAWILLYTAPAWVAVGAATLLREHVDALRWTLVAVTVAGVVLVAVGGGEGVTVTLPSVSWGLVAGWSYAAWYLVGKSLPERYSPVTISAWILVTGAAVLVPVVGFRSFPLEAWLLLTGLAIVSTYLPALAYYSGIATVDASRAAIVATIEPVVALGIGVLVADERLSPVAVLGGAVLLAAATIASARH
jgi:DME family drug/metabolite transporter